MSSPIRRVADGAAFAITFLTIVPLRGGHGSGATVAPAFFGLVGALIGGVGAGVYAVAQPVLGASLAALLAITAVVALTGGLHHDGLADCADGMGVRGDRERRLAVMREPSIGAFGALALILWALLMTTALAQLETREAVLALVCAASVGRSAALLHARWLEPARSDGLGAAFSPSTPATIVAGLTTAGVAALTGPLSAVGILIAGALSAAAVTEWAQRAVGGRTGDTLGATVVLAELAVVLVLVGFW